MSTHYQITVFFEEDGEGFHAFCPALPGLHAGGDTEEEVEQNAKDAVYIYLQSMIDHEDPIPVACQASFDLPANVQRVRTLELALALP